MIDARDLWAALATGAPSARVVVRLADGTEVDVESVTCHGQLVVIRTDEPIYSSGDIVEETTGDDPITPAQITDLLDAHSANIDVMTALLGELEGRGVVTVGQLTTALDLAADIDDSDDQDVLT